MFIFYLSLTRFFCCFVFWLVSDANVSAIFIFNKLLADGISVSCRHIVQWHHTLAVVTWHLFVCVFMTSRHFVFVHCAVGVTIHHHLSLVLYTLCAIETLDFPKQRLFTTAYSPTPKTAGRRVEWAKIKQSTEQPIVINLNNCPPEVAAEVPVLIHTMQDCLHLYHVLYCKYTLTSSTVCIPPLPCPLLMQPLARNRESPCLFQLDLWQQWTDQSMQQQQ